jgi:hypothetical protein
MFRRATVEELRQILKEDYGKTVSFEEAVEILKTFTGYYELLLRISTREMSGPSTHIAYKDNSILPNRLNEGK